jgi:hypothetical protein
LIWLTWRQSHLKAASAAMVLAAFAALLAVTGPHLASLYAGSRIGSCEGGLDVCGAAADDFLQQLYGSSLSGASSVDGTGTYWLLYLLGIVIILAAPAVIGIFWGAPLIAGEFEAGTHYLVWNQSITRTRWLAAKLTLTGLAAVTVTEALSLMQAWWATPISLAVGRGACCSPMAMNHFSPLVFATHGITPLGYAAFAFALGVTAGMLVRRAVPGMALTLAVFFVLQVIMPLWIRPHLFPPDHTITTLSSFAAVDVPINGGTLAVIPDGFDSQPEAWVLSSGAVDTAGKPVSTVPAACMQVMQTGKASHTALLDCLASHGIRIAVTYQPASRYWAFQWTETAIYVAAALALAGYCFWRIRRRLS